MNLNCTPCSHKKNKGLCDIKVDYSRNCIISDYAKKIMKVVHKVDLDPQDLFAKIANKFSVNCEHAQKVYDYISRGYVVCATPIIRNISGTDKYPISCFVNTISKDKKNLISQFHTICEQAVGGGGMGIDMSQVLEFHSKDVNYINNGILAYISAFEAMFDLVEPNKDRASVFVHYLDIDHPDIEEFMSIRKPTMESHKLRVSAQCHIGVIVSDKFMQALESGGKHQLISRETGQVVKEVDALDIWIKLLSLRSETGEPFIFFDGNAQKAKAKAYQILGLDVPCTNMCTEIMLPHGPDHQGIQRSAICCLSSLNLERYDEWKDDKDLFDVVYLFLDCVMQYYIDQTANNPLLNSSRHAAIKSRPVGLGVLGFHFYLQKHGISFESEQAREINDQMFKLIHHKSELSSQKIGEILGHAPDNIEAGLKGRFVTKTAIAPTAYISLIANSSQGINPFYSNYFTHKTAIGSNFIKNKYLDEIIQRKFPDRYEEIWKNIISNNGSIQNISDFDEREKQIFKTAFEIDQSKHILMSAERQKYICQTQSVNLFFNIDAPKKYISDIHRLAYKLGMPTLYYFFYSPRMLSTNKSKVNKECENCGN